MSRCSGLSSVTGRPTGFLTGRIQRSLSWSAARGVAGSRDCCWGRSVPRVCMLPACRYSGAPSRQLVQLHPGSEAVLPDAARAAGAGGASQVFAVPRVGVDLQDRFLRSTPITATETVPAVTDLTGSFPGNQRPLLIPPDHLHFTLGDSTSGSAASGAGAAASPVLAGGVRRSDFRRGSRRPGFERPGRLRGTARCPDRTAPRAHPPALRRRHPAAVRRVIRRRPLGGDPDPLPAAGHPRRPNRHRHHAGPGATRDSVRTAPSSTTPIHAQPCVRHLVRK